MSSKEINIAVIRTLWNSELTNRLQEDLVEDLNNYYLDNNITLNIHNYIVPGAVELPVTAKNVILHKKVDAAVCIGAIIKGESDHYTHVANQASYGCQKVAIETNTPVIFGVLTCEHMGLAKARVYGEHSRSGKEWAQSTIDIINVIASIKKGSNDKA